MTPKNLNADGKRLLEWLATHFDTTGVEPLCLELAHLAARLSDVRAALPDAKTPADRARLISAEIKLSAAFVRVWRALGLDSEDLEAARNAASEKTIGR
jgi:hypothetical protein